MPDPYFDYIRYNCPVFTTYTQAIAYLESLIPFTRIRDASIDPLERMRALLSVLGDPQKDFISVQVSGTSGKGSTSYLLSLALSSAGYKTGLSTSPHLERATERMKINGAEITEADFIDLLTKVKRAVEKVATTPHGQPTYFEALLAVGFLYFAQQKVDVAVIEVGLEGKYDGTNTLEPILGILTNISIDHVEYLGNTIEKIATEAVGMIKKDMDLVTGVTQKSVLSIVQDVSNKQDARTIVASEAAKVQVKESSLNGSIFSFKGQSLDLPDLSLSLVGNYQVENATLVLLALEVLSQKGFKINEEAIHKAFANAFFNGRFETFVREGVEVILDSAHNEAKMSAFVGELERLYPERKKIFIIAFKKEKDLASILNAICMSADEVIISEFHVTIDVSRNATMHVADVSQTFETLYPQKTFFTDSSPTGAYKKALVEAKKTNSLVVVTGSMYFVGQMRSLIIVDSQ